jgi:hypothetical protein
MLHISPPSEMFEKVLKSFIAKIPAVANLSDCVLLPSCDGWAEWLLSLIRQFMFDELRDILVEQANVKILYDISHDSQGREIMLFSTPDNGAMLIVCFSAQHLKLVSDITVTIYCSVDEMYKELASSLEMAANKLSSEGSQPSYKGNTIDIQLFNTLFTFQAL